MESALSTQRVMDVLERLHVDADNHDPQQLARFQEEMQRRGGDIGNEELTHLLGEAYIPVDRQTGKLLHFLVRSHRATSVVEFGTSYGISTIYLAAAVRDNGGRLTTTELEPNKARTAWSNLAEAGLDGQVELRVGDALNTLQDLPAEVDFVLLDGWKDLYLPVLRLIEPRLRPGALVVADDLDLFPEKHRPYLAHVRDPQQGYLSVDVPVGDRLEISLRLM